LRTHIFGTKLLFLELLLRRVGRNKPYTFKIKIPYNKGKKPKSGKKVGKKNLTPLGLDPHHLAA
jgi:hypothetical protein